ncbi:MAG: TonB-dependent receptor plug domain-containing protein, partial [Proteiniphilum sp.]|nr:TonB-dependent receptor plug domain-containing protein [Proteiniphilum sp.]
MNQMIKSKVAVGQKCCKTFKVFKVVTLLLFFVIFSMNATGNAVFIETNVSKFKYETISESAFEVGVSVNSNTFSNSYEMPYDPTGHENSRTKKEALQKQKKQISGIVVDENSLPIIGANVVELSTSNGTITDINGRFSLTVEDSAIIRISYIGYIDLDISTEGKYVFNITLQESAEEIDEVVVVGYGTQKKISVTGSISQISTDNVLKISTPNIANAISGKMPGIITRQSSGEPGYDAAQVYIRGLASLTNNSPLILVDGVERDMNLINAQEVETFTVLKDASATAVYGARGANGVILITTKRGEERKPVVILRSEFASLYALRLPNYINSEKYALLMNEALSFNRQGERW